MKPTRKEMLRHGISEFGIDAGSAYEVKSIIVQITKRSVRRWYIESEDGSWSAPMQGESQANHVCDELNRLHAQRKGRR